MTHYPSRHHATRLLHILCACLPAFSQGAGSPPTLQTPAIHAIQVEDIDQGTFCYQETLNPSADISDLKAAFTGTNWLDTILAVYGRRWPSGKGLAQAQAKDTYFSQFVDKTSFNKMAESLMVAIHEETHMWDLDPSRTVWNQQVSAWVDSTWQGNKIPVHDGFPRKEILPLITGDATKSMDDTYLRDATQGEYHFQGILSELNAGLMGLGAVTVLGDYIDGYGASNSRDIAATNIYYLQLYLRTAKAKHPDFWYKIKEEPALRKFILIQFLRYAYFMDLSTKWASKLGGPRVKEIADKTYAPENLGIIEEFTGYKISTQGARTCMGSVGQGAPVITAHPQPESAAPGQSATFSVTATGTTPMAFEWRKDGVALALGNPGATYTIPNVKTEDAGAYSVLVSNEKGSLLSNSANLTVSANPAPALTRFSPTSGPVGTSVTLEGTGFTGATAVRFNGTSATFTPLSDTQVKATVPSGATSGPISLVTPHGTATSATTFSVTTTAPTITAFSPRSGRVGSIVTISGTGFTGATAVHVNGTSATFTVASDVSIRTRIPTGATSGPLSVTTPKGKAVSKQTFTVVRPRWIRSW